MRNIKITIEYDGSRYKGWQKQSKDTVTIEGKIENVLGKMTGENVQLIGCGRTDIGVHAENYIANFHTECGLSTDSMMDYLYEFLPDDIVVKSITEVGERFHSRYNVKSNTYVYRINSNKFRSVFNRKYVYHIEENLNIENMIASSKCLIGTKDLESFTNLKPKNKSTLRTINYIKVNENKGAVDIEINGDEFLWNTVRMIVGTLIEVGKENLKVSDVENILNERVRYDKCQIAKAKGLCLKEVKY